METFDRSLVRAIEGFLLFRVFSGRCKGWHGCSIQPAGALNVGTERNAVMQKQKFAMVVGFMLATGIGLAQDTNTPASNVLSANNLAVADSDADAAEQEIIVSASRDRRQACQIPANVTVLDAQDIEESDAATLVDVLQNMDGIYFRSSSGNAVQAEVSMRGFGENSHGRVLVLLNGRRLNNPDMASISWAQIPLNNVERIEVLRGGQSALYGDNAVGGVINIITKKGTPQPEISAGIQVGSYGLNIERVAGSGSTGPLNYSANIERNQADGYRERSTYMTWGGGASLGYDINARNNVALQVDYDIMDYQLPGYLTRAQMDVNPRQSFMPNDDASSDMGNVDLSLKSLWSDDLRLDVDLIGGRKKMVTDMASWFSYSDVAINRWGATPRLTWSRDLLDHGNKVLVGFDGYADRLDSKRYADRARQFEMATAQIDKYTLGVYAREELAICEPLLLGLGARHEQARIGANVNANDLSAVDDHKTHKVNALDASLTYVFPNKSKVFARAGTVYRFPFVDEQISYIGYGTDQMYTDLDPEKGQNYEVGVNMILLENLEAGLTLFRLDMQDEIAYDAVTMSNKNIDDTRRQGLESYATWKCGRLMRWNANYTFIDAKFAAGANDGNKVPLVPRQKTSLGVRFYLPFDFALDGVATYVGKQRLGSDYANTGDTLDAYALVDLALRYTPARLAWLGLEAFAGVDNVFDKQYASVGYMGWVDGSFSGVYYPSPGRTYKAGLSCRF